MSSYSINPSNRTNSETSTDTFELSFTLQDVKSAIPAECFRPSLTKSFFYLFFDILMIGLLYVVGHYLGSWFFWPVFWLMQGTMFWALFAIRHDCGHQSFCGYRWLNQLIGYICYTPLPVPYHG